MSDKPKNDPRLDIAASMLAKVLPGEAFILLTCPFNNKDGRCVYISNAQRENAIEWMEGMIAKWKKDPSSWAKHV